MLSGKKIIFKERVLEVPTGNLRLVKDGRIFQRENFVWRKSDGKFGAKFLYEECWLDYLAGSFCVKEDGWEVLRRNFE